ncbi:tyrosine-type recombinase/integrase [Acinetobacter baumannii]|jgi:integrase|uniref:Site-specific integrase n=2 Tax=Acinetobacter TaxID=469 RepID=A0A3A8F2G0_9GAMM|nr:MULTISPECIES: tyrosine-type recombinase/integrase [Acinetobacter]MDN5490130.1 tyrosine-type recombinase/integrase [Acinetobacter sp.]AUX88075.1 integrase [Acinetobacter sp. ACNIH2]KAB1599061.1 tyrosine-type recombinase/integrase [Acinetobacter baumannii]MBK1434230.1 tyrosine-type recombinase/integrase [Acinetobacter pittii]MBK1437820.1 tyrosine-type recombinase/integrase [Acinetobacter pittii]
MQEFEELIKPRLDKLFVDMGNLVQKWLDRQPFSPEVLPQDMQQKIDQQVKEKWHDLKDGVEYLSRKLSRAEQSKLMQFTENEFKKRRKQFNLTQLNGKPYKIKLIPNTKRIVLPRKIESTESRLKQGQLHAQVLNELKQYWKESLEYWDDSQSLWGNLCLSLIYISGCSDEQHLIAIQKQLQDAIELDTDLNCLHLYHSGYKRITNPLLLHYRVENSQYGNDVEQRKLYQWRHVFLNPYAQLILQYLKKLKETHKVYRLQVSIQACILESLSKIGSKKSLSDLKYQIKRRGFRAFNDVQMVLEFNPKLSLDVFLSNVLQQEIHTVSLRPSESSLLWSHKRDQVVEPVNQTIQFEQEQLHIEVPTVHRKLQTIPYELMLFDQKKSRAKKVERLDKKKNREERTIRHWKETQSALEQKMHDANTDELFLIEAQLRLIQWLLHLKNKGLQLSTIESYLGSFGKEFIFEIWLNKLDLKQQSSDDYEDLYRQLLNYSSERDEKATQRESVKGKTSKKMHQTAQYRFGRLKDFHKFCQEHYDAPEVLVLQNSNFKHLQICNARLVSPSLFGKLLEQLESLSQEPTASEWGDHLSCLKLMYLLSYRTGLRLNEVRCLKIQDVICPELLFKDGKSSIFNNITLHIRDNSYRRLKSQSANRQIPLKIALSDHEFLVVQHYIQHRYKQYMTDYQDDLLFSVNQRVLTDHCISKITVDLFNRILGIHHGFSFHTLRHSAANYLAITLLGSKEMVHTYTDCGWGKAKKMRDLLFGVKARADEEIIQHKWQVLAAWIGHSSIEQTASNYLHVLDLLAVDRIYNLPCIISKKVLEQCFGPVKSSTEYINLNRYTQQQKWFDSYHQQTQPFTMVGQQEKKFSIENSTLTPYQRLINFRDARSKDPQAQVWLQRCQLMCTKWMSPQKFNLKVENIEGEIIDEGWFEDLHNKARKLSRSNERNTFLDLYDQEENRPDIYQRKNKIDALKILLHFGKLRKNFLHFVCRDQDDEQRIRSFIAGMKPILGEELNLGIQNYPVNMNAPERRVQFSFQRIDSNKNVTVLVLFNLMLKIMQEDELWIK